MFLKSKLCMWTCCNSLCQNIKMAKNYYLTVSESRIWEKLSLKVLVKGFLWGYSHLKLNLNWRIHILRWLLHTVVGKRLHFPTKQSQWSRQSEMRYLSFSTCPQKCQRHFLYSNGICCSVTQSCPTLWPHGLQHARY